MGTCTGISSSCGTMGVALETRCHLGQTILYDTITKLGWSANIIHHGIAALIEGVLSKDLDWGENGETLKVPLPKSEDDCIVSILRLSFGYDTQARNRRTALSGSLETSATLPTSLAQDVAVLAPNDLSRH